MLELEHVATYMRRLTSPSVQQHLGAIMAGIAKDGSTPQQRAATRNSSTPQQHPVTDEQLIADLTDVRDAVKAELDELEPRRVALTARLATLEHTIAVYSGETPAPVRKPRAKRASSTRRNRRGESESAEQTTLASTPESS